MAEVPSAKNVAAWGLLVVGELLAQVDHVVQAGQQHVAERDPADRVVAGLRPGLLACDQAAREEQQVAQLLGQEREPG